MSFTALVHLAQRPKRHQHLQRQRLQPGDDITDDEFEALLDELHGKGQFSSEEAAEPAKPAAQQPTAPAGSDDEISDDEFEALLDQLHGSGQGPSKKEEAPSKPAPAPVDEKATQAVQKAKQQQAAASAPKAAPAPKRRQLRLQQRKKPLRKTIKKPRKLRRKQRQRFGLTPNALIKS